MDDNFDALRLEAQLCFPLYAAAREVVRQYTPLLEKIDLTYTQYITMMVLWERKTVSAKLLGEILHLDSGTLTPVVKALEKKGLVTKRRSDEDERLLLVSITQDGLSLKEKARTIPLEIGSCIKLSEDEAKTLYSLLYKILG